jgi:hypothetical protein
MKKISLYNSNTFICQLFFKTVIFFNTFIIKSFFALCCIYFFIKTRIYLLIFFKDKFFISYCDSSLINFGNSYKKDSKSVTFMSLFLRLLIVIVIHARNRLFSIKMGIIKDWWSWLIIIEFKFLRHYTSTPLKASF